MKRAHEAGLPSAMARDLPKIVGSAVAWVVFAGAGLLGLPVAERYQAAAWQWYKFYGYSNDGHINLSWDTGVFYSLILLALLGVALPLLLWARRNFMPWTQVTAALAVSITIANAAAYWFLALSPLNVWRE